MEALDVLEGGHDLHTRVRAKLRDDQCTVAQLAADSDPTYPMMFQFIDATPGRSDTHLLRSKDRVVNLVSVG